MCSGWRKRSDPRAILGMPHNCLCRLTATLLPGYLGEDALRRFPFLACLLFHCILFLGLVVAPMAVSSVHARWRQPLQCQGSYVATWLAVYPILPQRRLSHEASSLVPSSGSGRSLLIGDRKVPWRGMYIHPSYRAKLLDAVLPRLYLFYEAT